MRRFEDYLLSELKNRNLRLKEEKVKIESEIKLLQDSKLEFESELKTFKDEYESLKLLEQDYIKALEEKSKPKAMVEIDNKLETINLSDIKKTDNISSLIAKWIEDKKISPDIFKSIAKDNYPLSKEFYIDQRQGEAWAQLHIRGVETEKYKAIQDKKMELWEALIGQSAHIDLRINYGLDKLVQFVITENDIQSMVNMMKGTKRETINGIMNVQHSKVVSKPSGEPPEGPERYYKAEPALASVNEEGAKIAQSLDISDGSYWIEPGGIGSTVNTYSYMMLIWKGKIITGTERHDLHELFMYKEKSNDELFNGKFTVKCLSDGTSKRWEVWKSITDPKPMDSILHADCGYHWLVPEEAVDGLGREYYRNISVELYKKKLG